jgi:hypothetical protein
MPIETDAKGMVVTRPVLGWTTAHAPGIAVILQIRYSDRPADVRTGGKSLQVVLTPPQCMELAEALTKNAQQILNSKASSPSN